VTKEQVLAVAIDKCSTAGPADDPGNVRTDDLTGRADADRSGKIQLSSCRKHARKAHCELR
jgi:hypothetical protein